MSSTNSDLASFSVNKTIFHKNHALTIQNLSLSHDNGRVLFENADIVIQYDCVTGLVGTNGAGKSSLAKLIASKTLPGFPDINIEYLAASDDEEFLNGQAEDFLDLRPVSYMEHRIQTRSDQLQLEIDQLEALLEVADTDEMERLANDLSDLYDLQEQLVEQVQRELDQAVSETGLSRYLDKPLSQLSCGWRYKTRLIAGLLAHPDLMIIDEPSFLDRRSTEWFIRSIKSLKTTAMVILISHKEQLLETLCDHILYINSGNLTLSSYHCSYSVFRNVHESQVNTAQKTIHSKESKHSTAEKSLKNLQSQLKRREKNLKETTSENADKRFIKGKNKEAKQKADKSASSKLKQTKKEISNLEDMKRQARTERVKELHLESLPVDGAIIRLVEVAFGYDEENLFENVDVCMEATDRVLLTGFNGCGKSTLVKIILGELEPIEGTVNRKGSAIYFPQTALSELLRVHGSTSARLFLSETLTETQARNHLGDFGLAGDVAVRPIKTLSAGQRVRLWLAKQQLFVPKASLLVVDEISENVDVETRKSLTELISSYQGAVLVVSHDPDFVEHLSLTKTWELTPNGMHELYPEA